MKTRFLLFLLLLGIAPSVRANFTIDGTEYKISGSNTVSVNRAATSQQLIIPDSVEYASAYYRVTKLESWCFEYDSKNEVVSLPASLESIDKNVFISCKTIRQIELRGDNPFFSTEDGILFSKDKTKLLYYPQGRNNTTYTIPPTVKEIADYAFSKNEYLDSIFGLESISSLGKNVFEGCKSLRSLILPPFLHYIPAYLFKDCKNLTRIELPKTLKIIENYAFYNSGIQTIVLPDSLQEIKSFVFNSCRKLLSVRFPTSLKRIGDGSFGSSSLWVVIIPSNIQEIGNLAFSDCQRLTRIEVDTANPNYYSINGVLFNKEYSMLLTYPGAKAGANYKIPPGTMRLGSHAFSEVQYLKSLTIPSFISNVEYECFFNCKKLKSLKLSPSIKVIEGNIIYYCPKLKELILPEGIRKINQSAIYECEQLTSLKLPKSLDTLHLNFVRVCENFASIEVKKGNRTYSSIDGVLYTKDKKRMLLYPVGRKNPDFTLPETVTHLNGSFRDNKHLEHVILTRGISTLNTRAFELCTNLKDVLILGNIRSIPSELFSYCTNLETIILPSTVEEIGSEAFNNCINLQSINIPTTIQKIGKGAFRNCSSIPKMVLPKDAKIVEEFTFFGCKSIKNIQLPPTIEKIETSAFGECSALQSINFPETLTTINENAFAKCVSLQTLTFPTTITFVGIGAFSGCKNIRSLQLKTKKPFVLLENTFDPEVCASATVDIPAGSLPAYQSLKCWSVFPQMRKQ